jgi:glycopeptide antibiotics resistance protein
MGVAATLGLAHLGVVLGVVLRPKELDAGVRPDIRHLLEHLVALGWPGFLTYAWLESAMNVVLFVPLGFTASLLFPRRWWWLAVPLGGAVAAAAEWWQAVFLPARQSSPADVVADTAGAAIGALLAGGVRLLVLGRDRLVQADLRAGDRPPRHRR